MAGDLALLYFAWVREGIGVDGERIARPAAAATVADVIAALAGRGGGYAVLADVTRLRAALDQDFVTMDTQIGDAVELAIFPPVTGGAVGG